MSKKNVPYSKLSRRERKIGKLRESRRQSTRAVSAVVKPHSSNPQHFLSLESECDVSYWSVTILRDQATQQRVDVQVNGVLVDDFWAAGYRQYGNWNDAEKITVKVTVTWKDGAVLTEEISFVKPSSVKINEDSFFGRMYWWYMDHGGKRKNNLCPVFWDMWLWPAVAYVIDAGFLTKYKFIRIISVMLGTALGYAAFKASLMTEDFASRNLIYMLVLYGYAAVITACACDAEDSSKYDHGLAARYVWFVVLLIAGPIYVFFHFVGPKFDAFFELDVVRKITSAIWNVLEVIFQPVGFVVMHWIFIPSVIALEFKLYKKLRVWHALLSLTFVYCFIRFEPVREITLVIGILVAVCVVVVVLYFIGKIVFEKITHLRDAWLANHPRPQELIIKRASHDDTTSTSWDIVKIFHLVHKKICPPVEWVRKN